MEGVSTLKKEYSVISHTHWDREWYQPLENFRVRLVELMDNLLLILEKDKAYKFHLDAQTIVLEDYLEIKPENKDKLKAYITEGRILVGPWYVQNDFFLTSGEATVRNLLIGSAIAQDYGKCTFVGYAPDQFGIISQYPQIMNQFGMDTCIFGRGYPSHLLKKAEFYWNGEDGSQVLAIHMPFWYNNAQRFSADPDKAIKMLQGIKSNLARTSTTNHYLLMNGVDHLEAQEDLLPILQEINRRLPKEEHILQDTMPDYVEKLKASIKGLESYTGEMRSGGLFNILAGTLSSRVYLKQWNVRCQTLIEQRLEPLYSFIDMLGIGEYPKSYFRYLWKLLIQNHPHDSICGCSVDVVHEHMVDRFKRFYETGSDLLDRGMELLSAYMDRNDLSGEQYLIQIVNTNPSSRCSVVTVELEFPEADNVDSFCITDPSGYSIPFVILNKVHKAKGLTSPINLPGVIMVTSYKIMLWIESIPGMSYQTFVVTPGQEAEEVFHPAASRHGVLENEYLKATILSNGSVDLLDKESNQKYNHLLILEDMEDPGDSYVYREDPNRVPILSKNQQAEIALIRDNFLNTAYRVSYHLSLPEEYSFHDQCRSNKTVDVPITMLISLDKGSKQLNVTIKIDNKVKDHRIRILFPTGIKTGLSMAGSPFDVVLKDKGEIGNGNQEVAQQPNTVYVNVDGADAGIAFLNEGLYEYENLSDDENTIALTLIRGNGFISRDQGSLPLDEKWLVPDNQCLGVHSMRLAIYPHKGDFLKGQVALNALDFLNPTMVGFQPVNRHKLAGGRPFVQDSDVSEIFYRENKKPGIHLPLEQQLFDLSNEDIQLSCLKKKEKGDSIIVRVYNLACENRSFAMSAFIDIKEAYRVNLKEERHAKIKVNERALEVIAMKPKEILTLELVFKQKGDF